ncbi:MAG: GNAT family N-acetyltransferase [Pseudomonadota bacterium]
MKHQSDDFLAERFESPDALASLHAKCFEAAPRPWSASEFKSLLSTNGVHLVARPGGFALCRVTGPEAELLTIAVDPIRRREGLGRRLLRDLELRLRDLGAEEIFLEVAETNIAARSLYADSSFQTVGHRRGYYRTEAGDEVDAMILSKVLAPKN